MKLWSVDEKLNKIENTVVWGRNYREEWEDTVEERFKQEAMAKRADSNKEDSTQD
jgi:hypothetical protein